MIIVSAAGIAFMQSQYVSANGTSAASSEVMAGSRGELGSCSNLAAADGAVAVLADERVHYGSTCKMMQDREAR